ncbi:MAG: hypothetical protein QHI48_06415 [Bacteroidota bacterium]|nr:hypothetical protein [Bacteroidota bacterium]
MGAKETENIDARIAEVVTGFGARLVDIVRRRERGVDVVEVFVDHERGITVEELADLSRSLSPMVETALEARGAYRLNVSSPGLDRPLRFGWQYSRHAGRTAQIVFEAEAGERTVVGKLLGEENGVITVEEGGELFRIPFEKVRRGVVLPLFKETERKRG